MEADMSLGWTTCGEVEVDTINTSGRSRVRHKSCSKTEQSRNR